MKFIVLISAFFMLRSATVAAHEDLLSHFVQNPTPWTQIEANSEQRQPIYIGSTPREMALGLPLVSRPTLYDSLRILGEKQIRELQKILHQTAFEVETWPVLNDEGKQTWAFARWRPHSGEKWKWIQHVDRQPSAEMDILPTLPIALHASKKEELSLIVDDFLQLKDLYDKPAFGNCIFTDLNGEVSEAWLPLSKMDEYRSILKKNPKRMCQALPQPARFNNKPVSFVLTVSRNPEIPNMPQIKWPTEIQWREAPPQEAPIAPDSGDISAWPRSFKKEYQQDIRILSGETEAVFPISGRQVLFTRKNNAQVDHQLEDLVDYLEERYETLGVKTQRQSFFWRGIPQSNLIAIIPGNLKGNDNHPVLMADHIDTAFCQDEYDKTSRRVSAPGADDNVSAVSALLRAADVLRKTRPRHDIWLVHLTGEEFPADDMGARFFVSELLKKKQEISGLVLLDMVGYRSQRDRIFQINAGESIESLKIALSAQEISKQLAPEWLGVVRTRFDDRSYLYNTDGLIFSEAGFHVILLNEHINYHENLDRPHYHETTDTAKFIDWDYATSIVKVGIQTVSRLAAQP